MKPSIFTIFKIVVFGVFTLVSFFSLVGLKHVGKNVISCFCVFGDDCTAYFISAICFLYAIGMSAKAISDLWFKK